jgi:hypothetical protein
MDGLISCMVLLLTKPITAKISGKELILVFIYITLKIFVSSERLIATNVIGWLRAQKANAVKRIRENLIKKGLLKWLFK